MHIQTDLLNHFGGDVFGMDREVLCDPVENKVR